MTKAVSSAGLAWFWSSDQDRAVLRLYRSYGAVFLAERLGKTVRAVETRALRLGAAKKQSRVPSQTASAFRARRWRLKRQRTSVSASAPGVAPLPRGDTRADCAAT